MSSPSLEDLETRMARLEKLIEKFLPLPPKNAERRDWRRSLDKITDDEITREIIAEARRLREAERAQVQL